MTTLRAGSATDVGQVRSNNQDSLFLAEAETLYGVADGMGGHQGGEVASAMAVELVERHATERTLDSLRQAVRVANRAIFEKAGADVLFVPLPGSLDDLRRICRSVSGPVNALAAGPLARCTLAEFAAAGVARISLGASLARVTHRAIVDCAAALFERGEFACLADSISGSEVERLIDLGGRAPAGS